MNSTGLCYHCDNSILDTDIAVTIGPIRLHETCVEDYIKSLRAT